MGLIAAFTMGRKDIVKIYKIPFEDLLVKYEHFNGDWKTVEVLFPGTIFFMGIGKILELGAHYHDVGDRSYSQHRFSEELLSLPIPDPHPGLKKAVEALGQKLYWPCCWMGIIQAEGIGRVSVNISKGRLPSTVNVAYGGLISATEIPAHLVKLLLQAIPIAEEMYAEIAGTDPLKVPVEIVVDHSEGETSLTAWGNTFTFPSAEAAITALLMGNMPGWR